MPLGFAVAATARCFNNEDIANIHFGFICAGQILNGAICPFNSVDPDGALTTPLKAIGRHAAVAR